jgi:Rne/Rng family ribonuclease
MHSEAALATSVEVPHDPTAPILHEKRSFAPGPSKALSLHAKKSRSRRGDPRHHDHAVHQPARHQRPAEAGQEIWCRSPRSPIAKKGARITSHIALPGRFLVFMPTVNHTGVSRKIESDGERRRLKEILLSEKGEASGGFIVRTAAGRQRRGAPLRPPLPAQPLGRHQAALRVLKSPALIYHDLNLVERILRDQVTDNFSAIWVDTETEYERVLRFLQRFQPSLIRRVKLYTKETPLFEQFGITEEINKALRSKVWLKSGGSIVINQTEALVAIDINTGKYVGKTARLEDTIVKTNLDAIPEIVRQIRLRDLGGIIIIDFIDMDERKNRNKVMAALEEELKNDRAPSKVLQFNDFGLVAITRKRVKQSLERTLSTTCNVCAGHRHGQVAVTVCNDIYIEMRKMQKHLDRGDVMLRVNPEVVKAAQIRQRQVAAGDGRDGRQDHPRQERPQPAPGAVRHPLALLAQFDFNHFGLQTNTLNNLLGTYQTLCGTSCSDSGTAISQIGGTNHIWSFTVDPMYTYMDHEKFGGYVIGGVGFYHKVTDFTTPATGEYCDPYYGCYEYQANQTIDSYVSNAFGANGGLGFTYKGSRFSDLKFYAEARYVYTANSRRPYYDGTTGTSLSSTYFNVFPQNSAPTTYIPITFGVRF